MVKIKSIFPTDKNEIDLVKFINTYQYLSPKDLPYFFNTTYYPKRIAKLIQNNILRRYKRFLVLGEDGYNFMKILGLETNKLRYQEKYANRLKFMSHLAAHFRYSNVTFTPSFLIKDKTAFTESSRKYIGVSNIFGTKYLTYHISNEHTDKYLNSVIYDLQKELKYKNVIIMIDDIARIDFLKFSFGLNSVIICGDTDKALDKIKYLQQISWTKVIQTEFKEKLKEIAEMIHTSSSYITKIIKQDERYSEEKINRISTFMQNNTNKKVDIICPKSIVKYLGSELATCNFHLIDIDKFIEKEINFYE